MNADEPIELPEILHAEWGRDQVAQLFANLAAGADVEHVQLRTETSDAAVSLGEAEAAFRGGSAAAIQVRYRYDGQSWSDTILPGEPTTRIIRTRMDHLPGHP